MIKKTMLLISMITIHQASHCMHNQRGHSSKPTQLIINMPILNNDPSCEKKTIVTKVFYDNGTSITQTRSLSEQALAVYMRQLKQLNPKIQVPITRQPNGQPDYPTFRRNKEYFRDHS